MKTMTITFHGANNCGSFFQAYALQKILMHTFETENQIIDYRSSQLEQNYSLFHPFNSPKNIWKDFYSLMHYSALSKRNLIYHEVRSTCLCMTNTIHTQEALSCFSSRADLFISGSDQVFNTTAPDFSDAFFLPGFHNKIAYGVSLGRDADNDLSAYAHYIQEFTHICVREPEVATILSPFYSGEISVVADPVLLLSTKEYDLLLKQSDTTFEKYLSQWKEGYIFYYSMKYDARGIQQAMELSQKTRLPVLTVYTNFHTVCVPHAFKVCYDTGPMEFLYLLKSSTYVVTDSYHGIVFSILYHKKFLCPENELICDNRLRFLIHTCGIETDWIRMENCFAKDGFAWDSIDKKIALFRKDSLDILQNMLQTFRE